MPTTAILRRAAGLLAALLGAALLAGCVVTSEDRLLPEGSGEQLFGPSFTMVAYNDAKGVFNAAKDSPEGDFRFTDGGYVAPDNSMTVSFLPAPDGGDYYMLSIAADDGYMYGTARVGDDGIMELRVVLDGNVEEDKPKLPSGAVVSDGGIQVMTLADLEAIVTLIGTGALSTSPLIAYGGPGPAPATLVADGDWYKPAD